MKLKYFTVNEEVKKQKVFIKHIRIDLMITNLLI